MKKIVFICFLCLNICVSQLSLAKTKEPLDKVVAIVNDDVVTQTELNKVLNIAKLQFAQQSLPVPPEDKLKQQALDQLINKKLQLQIAKQAGIKTTDQEINQAIERIAKQNNMSSVDLLNRIQQDGMPKEDYRNELRDQITLRRLQQQEAVKNLSITPAEINAFMHTKAWQSTALKEYRLEDILIPVSDAPKNGELIQAKKEALATIEKLQQGKTISDLKQDNATIQTGDLGWRRLNEIPTAFAEKVAQMKKDSYVGPIQTSNGFHVVHLTDVKNSSADKIPSKEQVRQLLMQKKFEQAVVAWVSKLRGQSFIKTDL